MHELLEYIHKINLLFSQKVIFGFGNLKEHTCNTVPPIFEKSFWVFLDIHQFVNNMQFKIKLSSIDCVLARTMKMELHAPRSEGMIAIFFLQVIE